MIDPETLVGLPDETRREVVLDAVGRECLRAAQVIGPDDPLHALLRSCAVELMSERPPLRALPTLPPAAPRRPALEGQMPLLRAVPPAVDPL